jgi:galactitol-specific phosphotransferase system IIC component
VIPFSAGAVVPYTKGNVVKTVIVLLLYAIPFMYLSTLTVDAHTKTFEMMGQYGDQIAQGLKLGSWDMGGDILGFVIQSIFRLFGG